MSRSFARSPTPYSRPVSRRRSGNRTTGAAPIDSRPRYAAAMRRSTGANVPTRPEVGSRRSMCGISGFVGPPDPRATPAVAQAMADVLEHRGPDGDGGAWFEWDEGPERLAGWLGHRRLRI